MPAKKKKSITAKTAKKAAPSAESTEHHYAHITHETPLDEQAVTHNTLEAPLSQGYEGQAQVPEEIFSTPETREEMVTIHEAQGVSMEQRTMPRRKIWIVILVLMLLVMAGVAGVMKYESWKAAKNPTYAAEVRAKDLISKVGALTDLPKGENPTIAVVSDVAKLPKVPLFSDARNGDEVLVYTNAHKAYVYRPSTNKIIAIGPITIASNQSQSASGSVQRALPVTVVIYNGTNTAGLAKRAQLLITSKDKTASISAIGDAAAKTYTATTVVDLTGKNSDAAKTIAGLIGGVVGTLPKTETAPKSTDLLVILGKDYVGK